MDRIPRRMGVAHVVFDVAVNEQTADHRQSLLKRQRAGHEAVPQAVGPGFGPGGLADATAEMMRVLNMTGGAGRRGERRVAYVSRLGLDR